MVVFGVFLGFFCEWNISSDILSPYFENILIFRNIVYKNSGRITAEFHTRLPSANFWPLHVDGKESQHKNDAARISLTSSQNQGMISTDPVSNKICDKYYLVYFQLILFFRPDSVI